MSQPTWDSEGVTCPPGASAWPAHRHLPLAPSLPATSKVPRTPGPPGQDRGGGSQMVSCLFPGTCWRVFPPYNSV